MSAKDIVPMLKETYNEWDKHQATRFGASVALYTLFSLAPLVILVAAVVALVFSHDQAQNAIVSEARNFMGQRGADAVTTLLHSGQKPATGFFATIIAFITLLFGASGVFIELRQALNAMWDVKEKANSGIMDMIKDRLFSFGMVLSVGFLLLVSLLLSTALSVVEKFFGNLVPVPPAVLHVVNFILSFIVISGLFALMFRFVPDTRVAWKDVGVGAIGTAFLFTVGKFALGLYLGMASVGSTYGAAGSLVAVVVWVYYSAQIFFFGAEFTYVYAHAEGTRAGQPKAADVVTSSTPKSKVATAR